MVIIGRPPFLRLGQGIGELTDTVINWTSIARLRQWNGRFASGLAVEARRWLIDQWSEMNDDGQDSVIEGREVGAMHYRM